MEVIKSSLHYFDIDGFLASWEVIVEAGCLDIENFSKLLECDNLIQFRLNIDPLLSFLSDLNLQQLVLFDESVVCLALG